MTCTCINYDGAHLPYIDLDNPHEVKYFDPGERIFECWQPDCLDNEEFNLLVEVDNRIIRARSIHFDFL